MTPPSKTQFGYRRHTDQDRAGVDIAAYPVVVVGAGPVGLSLAIDLAQRGQPVVLLDDADRIGEGSRAICFSKRSLEVWDRLGVGERMVGKGVIWKVGKIFLGQEMLYQFDLLPEDGHKMPAFINLQQYYAESFLVDRVRELPGIDLRWRNKVTGLTQHNDHAVLTIETPDGQYRLRADYVIACDGARSALRGMVGAEFEGEVFEDQFLIADVRMTAEFPTERWFWFDPPFHSGQSALLHRQPDDVWRIDLQIGPDADPAIERLPENVRPRLERMLGHGDFEFEWISIYKFQCRRMQRFLHGRVVFAGDSAHQVSPFGARGANSGLQDTDNLIWKLKLVLDGKAPESLLDSYDYERVHGAEENILNSSRSTDFITPKSEISRLFRDAVLDLSERVPGIRPLVNSGRLSVPCTYDGSPLNGPDHPDLPARTRPGAPVVDAPIGASWLIDALGNRFQLLTLNAEAPARLEIDGVVVDRLALDANSGSEDYLRQRYLGNADSAVYLLRPDQHVAARWTHYDADAVAEAVRKSTGR